MTTPYRILARKRGGEALSRDEIQSVVEGAAQGTWADAQLGAFLMAVAIRGLDDAETRDLTQGMMASGEVWDLRRDIPHLADKHSTGGVGDKISLILSPLLAACGVPVAMLTGRGLGHTGGTADKLESIPGVDLALDRARALRVIDACGLAIGMATGDVAPADKTLYALRDVTATIDSIPLITASILSKKLAMGAAGVAYDVKTGSGAFLQERESARRLAESLVEVSALLGQPARALVSDMSQPLGRWAGHAAEVMETLSCLAGEGPADLTTLTIELCYEAAAAAGSPLEPGRVEAALASGAGLEAFERWVRAQGGIADWRSGETLRLAPVEVPVPADRAGYLAAIDTRELGLLLAEAGGGRMHPADTIDLGVAVRVDARLGDAIEPGSLLARLYLRRPDDSLADRFAAAFTIGEEPVSPPDLVIERLGAAEA